MENTASLLKSHLRWTLCLEFEATFQNILLQHMQQGLYDILCPHLNTVELNYCRSGDSSLINIIWKFQKIRFNFRSTVVFYSIIVKQMFVL